VFIFILKLENLTSPFNTAIEAALQHLAGILEEE
jgi:hypothetical protein